MGNKRSNQSELSYNDDLDCQLTNSFTERRESPERNNPIEPEPLKIEIREDVATSPTAGGTIRKRRAKKRKRLNAPPKRSEPSSFISTTKFTN